MNHDDRFRSMFGFPGGSFGGYNHSGGGDDEEDEFPFGDVGDIFGRFRFGGFGRSNPFNEMNDIFRGAETMLRHMDSMFRDMHSFGEFGRIMGPDGGHQAGIPFIGDGSSRQRRRTPRDEMLKEPDSDPSMFQHQLEDRDLDSAAGGVDVDELLEQLEPGRRPGAGTMQPYRPQGPGFWSQGSSSMTTFSGFGDGKMEQRTTKRNADGSQSVTVTRRIGEKEYIVTTTVTPQGEKEVEEEFVNMDESEKDHFEEEWNSPNPERHERGRISSHYDRDYPMLDPEAPSLFSRLFGSWWK